MTPNAAVQPEPVFDDTGGTTNNLRVVSVSWFRESR